MAPSAVETVTVTQPASVPLKLHTTKAAAGDYKELLPVSYDKDAEDGKKGFSAAKVCTPVQIPNCNPCLTLGSTATTSQPGTLSRNTHP